MLRVASSCPAAWWQSFKPSPSLSFGFFPPVAASGLQGALCWPSTREEDWKEHGQGGCSRRWAPLPNRADEVGDPRAVLHPVPEEGDIFSSAGCLFLPSHRCFLRAKTYL